MTVDFISPSYRAAGSDLTVSISPLGLVELSDEEFEVNGPRLNRYAQGWAFFLGRHWLYRRENGEPQLTFNWCRAFSEFITNFCFGRGFSIKSPFETSAIVPSLLDRVWTQDNNKEQVLWEAAQQGSVGGDAFIKVAYEESHMQPPLAPNPDGTPATPIPGIQYRYRPGRVRILVVNQSYVYPRWHPHDRERLLQMKMKYKFWGSTTDGARSVFTYTEISSETAIEEYINDQLISSRPNPIGVVPWVHIPNVRVSGSPWGLSDIIDIIILNREYNEKATDVSDIVNYHSAPTTIMTGAKASQLEKGAKKLWAGLPKDAQVFNLELGGGGVESALSWMEVIKKAMHEITGVPEGALGDVQPISNTSGVALAIQYQPMMNRYNHKTKITYGPGITKINELILLTLALKEPKSLIWHPRRDEELKDGQVAVLDPDDPITYVTETHWPPPLPVDILVTLQEVQIKMQLGLMSKREALAAIGEEFPDEKMREVFLELVEDAIDNGALSMLRAQISQAVQEMTGQFDPNYPQPFPPPLTGAPSAQPGGEGNVTSAGGTPTVTSGASNVGVPGAANVLGVQLSPDTQKLLAEITTRAYGTRRASQRLPQRDDGDESE